MTLRGKFNGAKIITEAWDILMYMVGERCVRGEVIAEAVVDFTQVRMPDNVSTAVRLWEISFMVKRETAQTHS